jgi:hypothetical protein
VGNNIDGENEGDQRLTYQQYISLSSDGTILAVGATENDGNGTDSGHTRIHKWNGAAWEQLGIDIDGESAGDEFGIAVSLASNGYTVAIAAYDAVSTTYTGNGRVFHYL